MTIFYYGNHYEDLCTITTKELERKNKEPPKGKVVLPERHKQTRPPEAPISAKIGIT
ncbi:hypothetical protein M1N55_07230 [Dehalococcoidia bacterium]|nr:hypothetical protein [Dehalococcoidia bacterium]